MRVESFFGLQNSQSSGKQTLIYFLIVCFQSSSVKFLYMKIFMNVLMIDFKTTNELWFKFLSNVVVSEIPSIRIWFFNRKYWEACLLFSARTTYLKLVTRINWTNSKLALTEVQMRNVYRGVNFGRLGLPNVMFPLSAVTVRYHINSFPSNESTHCTRSITAPTKIDIGQNLL